MDPSRQLILGLVGLSLAVAAAHLWLAQQLWPLPLVDAAGHTAPKRIEVAFVRQLAPAAPAALPAPARAAPPAAVRSAPAPAVAASAASSAASAAAARLTAKSESLQPDPGADPSPAKPLLQSRAALQPSPELARAEAVQRAGASSPVLGPDTGSDPSVAQAPPLPAVAALPQAAHAEVWPPSTRLSYVLQGQYKGPVEGQARVEWLRSGTRYQVHMDVSVGPSFAPLMSRRVSSEGEITPAGLAPQRFDEVTKVVLRDARQLTVLLGPQQVRLANGQDRSRPVGVQDSASQFVQLTWLFTTQPELLQSGRSVELPLALPRTLENWTYDVIGPETLHTAAGVLETVHVKPRREVPREARPGSDLAAEFWVAPSLQYLPVRILIRQDSSTYMDLQLDRLPQQAAPER